MEVSSYVFQSPYHSSVQVGRPDPLAPKSESSSADEGDYLGLQEHNKLALDAAMVAKQSSGINVALSMTNESVSNSVSGFQSLNAQIQASQVYTG